LNTLECIRPRHAKRIQDIVDLDSLFSTEHEDKPETIKLNMEKEFGKHKAVMDLLAVFEQQTFSKTLQFYKQFGKLEINSVDEQKEKPPRHQESVIEDQIVIRDESSQNYEF
jgi:hypothetical protein